MMILDSSASDGFDLGPCEYAGVWLSSCMSSTTLSSHSPLTFCRNNWAWPRAGRQLWTRDYRVWNLSSFHYMTTQSCARKIVVAEVPYLVWRQQRRRRGCSCQPSSPRGRATVEACRWFVATFSTAWIFVLDGGCRVAAHRYIARG